MAYFVYINAFYQKYFNEIKTIINAFDIAKIEQFKKLVSDIKKKNKKILIFGNGGSAATASHFAVDITKNAGIRCLTLNEYDLITCFANDFGYENVFSRQLEALGRKKDLLITFSTSGNSKNIINLLKTSKKKKISFIQVPVNIPRFFEYKIESGD